MPMIAMREKNILGKSLSIKKNSNGVVVSSAPAILQDW